VGPAVAKVQVPKVLRRTRGTVIDDERLVADDGDRRRHQRREHSDRRGMLALGSGENDERSPPACTGPAGVRPVRAGRREAAVTVHVCNCR